MRSHIARVASLISLQRSAADAPALSLAWVQLSSYRLMSVTGTTIALFATNATRHW